MYSALNASNSIGHSTKNPRNIENPEEFGATSHSDDSSFSDFVHYITKSSSISDTIRTFIITLFSIQWIVISICPPLNHYWESDLRLERLVNLVGYISLIQAPPVSDESYLPLLITTFLVFFLSEVVLNGVHFYYIKKRYVHKFLCHFVLYFCLFVNTVFFPFICSITSRYLTASFGLTKNESTQIGVSLLSLAVLMYSFGRMFSLTLYLNYTISFNDALFQTRKPGSPTRLYASLGFLAFFEHMITAEKGEKPAIHAIILIISLFNCAAELHSIHWTITWQFNLVASSLLTSVLSSLAILLDICFKGWSIPKYIFWLTPIVFLVSFTFVPLYHKYITGKTMILLSKEDYPSKDRTISYILRDLNIGFQFDHPDVIKCTHISKILERYPDSFELYIFLARFSLVCNTCPIPMEEIGRRLIPRSSFAPIQKHVYISITRLLAPITSEEIEIYNKQVVSIRKNLYFLLASGKQLYDFLLDELTGTLPTATLSFGKIYDNTVFRLFRFVQRYPGSPDGDLFIELFENLFPDCKELNELRSWHNYSPNYINIATSISPPHVSARLENPYIFRSYKPEYLQKCTSKIEPLQIEDPEEQQQEKKKLTNIRGPYENVIRKWYIYFLLFVGLLLPVCLTPILMAQNRVYEIRTEHLTFAWSLVWKFEKMNTFLYATVFYSPSLLIWNDFIEPHNCSFPKWHFNLFKFINSLQTDLMHVSTGLGGSVLLSTDVLDKLSDFFAGNSISPLISGNFTISHGLLSSTFIGDEMLSSDPVYILQKDDISYNINILRELQVFYDSIFPKYMDLLETIEVDSEPLIALSPLVIVIVEVALLNIVLFAICFILRTAIFKSNLFFMTLRETSKIAIAHVRAYFIQQQENIGAATPQRHRTYKMRLFSFFIDFFIPVIILAILMSSCIIIHYFLYVCYIKQLKRKIGLYKTFANSYTNLSLAVQLHQEITFQRNINQTSVDDNIKLIDSYYQGFGAYSEIWGDTGSSFCPLCCRRDLYMTHSPSGRTFETSFFDWLSSLSLSIHTEVSPSFLVPFLKNVSTNFYFLCEPSMLSYLSELDQQCGNLLAKTYIYQYVTYFLYIFLTFIYIMFLILIIQKADMPFSLMVKILKPLPEKSLSRDTLRILAEHFWDFTVDHFEFDPSYYDKVLNILPDGVIVIDQTRSILAFNQAAGNIIETRQNVIGCNLFDSLSIDLKESNPSDTSSSIEFSFQDLVNDYLFDDRLTLPSHKLIGKKDNQCYWYSLTILPIFDEAPEQVLTQIHGADHFALIFRDIGDEIRQQNLLEEETEKHMSIVKQILPAEIAARLLREQRSISMTVDKVAIAFCDIVQFTPWCAQQTPEFVVNALNFMFKKFDELCGRYSSVTKIKCIGDCYMSAAGVFSQGQDPTISAIQMVHFCLDSIDGILVVNQTLMTSLRVRIGIAYGGPISAGVMGIHKPVFDIWGETVNDAQTMESSGEPMMVHIDQGLYNIIQSEPFEFNQKEDGTWLISRNSK